MGFSDLLGVYKASRQRKKVSDQIYNTFKDKATPSTRAGEKNFNTEQNTIRAYADNMDAQGAKRYAKGQNMKYMMQKMKGK